MPQSKPVAAESLLKIDAHQHFWNYEPVKHGWISDDMSAIRKDFLPKDLLPVLRRNDFDGCVLVQVDQTENETSFLLELAKQNDFVKGVVGWIDLESETIETRLAYYKQFEKLKGFRHILQGEKDRAHMLKPQFINGIRALKQFEFTYDILIFPDQLKYTKALVELLPAQQFVIDHLAKPYIKAKKINEWKEDIQQLAQYENVYCKISGMVTEADWQGWGEKDIFPYIDVVVDTFGTDRIMYGSDWPVCLVAAAYSEVVNVARAYFSSFTQNEQDNIFGQNAINFYNL
ncbi:MAG: amidohydrolase family protein [Ginsengibacter sp.]